MTCFWDNLRKGLNLKISNNEFITFLKKNNTKDINLQWNNKNLTKKQLEENYEHIKNYNIKTIYRGYDCSICDPFLILICKLYKININHNYNGHIMKYRKNKKFKILNFKSNRGHFMFK
tara:strand:- start:148 stop:504 length:357 start_codon:yes stop_codon:yes gene_type:complete